LRPDGTLPSSIARLPGSSSDPPSRRLPGGSLPIGLHPPRLQLHHVLRLRPPQRSPTVPPPFHILLRRQLHMRPLFLREGRLALQGPSVFVSPLSGPPKVFPVGVPTSMPRAGAPQPQSHRTRFCDHSHPPPLQDCFCPLTLVFVSHNPST
jgi:hypothetical protein